MPNIISSVHSFLIYRWALMPFLVQRFRSDRFWSASSVESLIMSCSKFVATKPLLDFTRVTMFSANWTTGWYYWGTTFKPQLVANFKLAFVRVATQNVSSLIDAFTDGLFYLINFCPWFTDCSAPDPIARILSCGPKALGPSGNRFNAAPARLFIRKTQVRIWISISRLQRNK